ncbi:hypothetical protein MLD38_014889 [Melastoma candidum]|uniref:Uncharacterized protein n=1 Tax=Melastoma candidum TaxID=119954 RepID=A0ACB9RHY7_9MYRT|nr:hypothetical protein MLD38_014889 [Melastoma candidum]
MGTEFVSAINLLTALPGRDAFPCRGSDDEWGYPHDGQGKERQAVWSGSWARILESMGVPEDARCLESIRRKMQTQEDTFKQQVRDLHRLYGTQKKIMGELKKEMERDRFSSPLESRNANYINWPHQMDQTAAAGSSFHLHRLNGDQFSQDRNASCSREATRIRRGVDREIRPSKGHDPSIDEELLRPHLAAPDTRLAERIDDGLDEERNVELTLGIGRESSRRKPESCSLIYQEPEVRPSKERSSASVNSDHRGACNSTGDQRLPQNFGI